MTHSLQEKIAKHDVSNYITQMVHRKMKVVIDLRLAFRLVSFSREIAFLFFSQRNFANLHLERLNRENTLQ